MADKSVVFVIRRKEEPSTAKPGLPQTGNAPVPSPEPKQSGGIFGRTDPAVKGFEKRQSIGGGVERLRDRTSRQAFSHATFIDEIKRLEKQIAKNTVSAQAVENIIKNHMDNLVKGSQILSDPQGFVGNNMLRLLGGAGPHGAAMVAAITAIITAPEVAKQLLVHFSQKGYPLNRDYRRNFENDTNSLFNVSEKKRRLLGTDAFSVTQTSRYQPDSGTETYNSFENRDEIIISKIGLAEKAVGIT